MLQPYNGIFIKTWYEDPHDTALFTLTPLLEELIAHRARVPEILDKYRDQIPTWAGFDDLSQLDGGPCPAGEYSEYYGEEEVDDGYGVMQPQLYSHQVQELPAGRSEAVRPKPQHDFQPGVRAEPPRAAPSMYSTPAPRAEAQQFAPQAQSQQQPQHEVAQTSYTGGYTAAGGTQYLQRASYAQASSSAPQRPELRPQAQSAQRHEPPKAAPTFSKVAGPYQAQQSAGQSVAQQQPQSAQPQAALAQGARPSPASATMWSRTGLGPHQALLPQRH